MPALKEETHERPDTWVTVCTGHIGEVTLPPLGEEAMPWKEYSVMDEGVRFVARLLEGDGMAALCREFASLARPATEDSRSQVWAQQRHQT